MLEVAIFLKKKKKKEISDQLGRRSAYRRTYRPQYSAAPHNKVKGIDWHLLERSESPLIQGGLQFDLVDLTLKVCLDLSKLLKNSIPVSLACS